MRGRLIELARIIWVLEVRLVRSVCLLALPAFHEHHGSQHCVLMASDRQRSAARAADADIHGVGKVRACLGHEPLPHAGEKSRAGGPHGEAQDDWGAAFPMF